MANTTSTTTFKADISSLKSAMQQAKRQVQLANSEFKAASATMDDWSDNADGLKAKLTQLNTVLSSQKTQLSLLEDELDKTVEEYGDNSAAADRVRISINNMKAEIAKTESQIEGYTDDLDELEKEDDDAAESMDDLTDATEDAGEGFTVFKGVLSDLISNVVTWAVSELKNLATEVVETGSSFEKSMSNVAAISGATEDELNLLTETAKEFGSNTQFSASEAADALSYMALAGWDAETSVSALGGVLDLAAASGMDLASASDMVTDYMSAFGMEAEESSYFADLLAYAQSNANTTAEDLGEAYKNCAANLSAAGQDVETTTALLSEMANQGLKGSTAGTALSAVMRDITKNMEDGEIAIGDTNVQVMDAEGNFRDLTDILKDVEDATDDMGDAEKSAALMSTFTSDSIKGLNLILNAGVDDAAEFEEELRNCTGTASDMAAVMNDNLSGDLTALNSKLEGVKITIYESFAPAMRDAVDKISEVIDSVDWSEVGQDLGELAVKAVSFFSTVVEHGDLVKEVLRTIGTTMGTAFVVTKVTSFATGIVSLYKTFTTLKTATDAATTSQLLLNVAQNAMPIGLIITAVATLATGLLYLISNYEYAEEEVATFNEFEQEQIDKTYELRDAYEDLIDTRDEEISALETEYGYYEDLADELDELVDANGNVKEGYEDRVNFILTTLNEACGTEMELVDGVIENYNEEKEAIESLIETKKAEAILSASEDAYTEAIQNSNEALNNYITTQGIYNENLAELADLQDEYNSLVNMTNEEYADLHGITDYTEAADALTTEQDELAAQIAATQAAVGESHAAMDTAKNTYEDYQQTIQNYEGLSSAIISGDSEKISEALTNLEYNFQTAETATRETLEQQVTDYEENLANLQQAIEDGTPSVTQEMVDQASAMVDAAKAELDKLPDEASNSASNAVSLFSTTLNSESNKALVKGSASDLYNAAIDAMVNDEKTTSAGVAFGSGYLNGIGSMTDTVTEGAAGLSGSAVDALNEGQASHSPSAYTTTSGENFGQGYIDGMDNKESSIWTKAWNLAKTALSALSAAQEEGSPSKLTKRSGGFFGEGYGQGIEGETKSVTSTVKGLVNSAITTLRKTQKEGSPSKLTEESGKNFTKGYINGIVSEESTLVKAVRGMTETAFKYAFNLKNFNFNEVAETASSFLSNSFSEKTDYLIAKINYQNQKKLMEFDKEVARLEEERDKELDKLNKQLDETEDEAIISSLNAQMDAVQSQYEKLINTQYDYKEAYSTASGEMLAEFTTAVNNYAKKAQELINSVIDNVGNKYEKKYNDLLTKQDGLISKLKSAGDLFEISGAGIMTVNDIKAQTQQIKDYASKLQAVKKKVSSELFDEIAKLDMKEGSAYIDRLLSLSEAELKAYSDAYDEKMRVSENVAESTYKKDFDTVASDYKKELKQAFAGLPKQLEELGVQSMKGFVNGLVKNTDYMDSEIKIFVNGMVDQFKDLLKIHSPSRVLFGLGDNSGEGFVEGLRNTISNAKRAAADIAKAVSVPMEDVSTSLASARASVGSSVAGYSGGTTNVTNNYNLVQNNNSPKSLSALETYRARQRQIEMIKALT